MLYSAKVMDHFTHPRNVGEMPDATAVGEVGNAKCGDIMKIYLKIDENDTQSLKPSAVHRPLPPRPWRPSLSRVSRFPRHLSFPTPPLWRHSTDCRRQRSTARCLLKKPSKPRFWIITKRPAATRPSLKKNAVAVAPAAVRMKKSTVPFRKRNNPERRMTRTFRQYKEERI